MADKDVLDVRDELERLLRQELSVEPSPAFAARVRQQVEQQRAAPWWRARWIPALGSAATLASIAFAITVPAIMRWTSAPVPPSAPSARAASVQLPSIDPVIPSQTPAPISRVRRTQPRASRELGELPEVIVDGRQRAALTTLFRMLEQGRVSGGSFAGTVPVSLEPIADQMGEITVLPVLVSAMLPGGVLHYNER